MLQNMCNMFSSTCTVCVSRNPTIYMIYVNCVYVVGVFLCTAKLSTWLVTHVILQLLIMILLCRSIDSFESVC